MKLSIIIPAYNEGRTISNVLREINNYLSEKDYSYEIIVVNDGSKDQTATIVKDLMGEISSLRLIDNETNKGKGAVVKQGMLAAVGEYRLYLDADNAIKINHLDKFLVYIEKSPYDVIIGSIEVKGSKKKQESFGVKGIYRNIFGKLSKTLIRLIVIWSIHDTQRAFKLFRAKHAQEVFSRQTIMRWGFDIEVLVIAKRLGYKIKELPVAWINPPSSSLNLRTYPETLKELLIIKFNSLRDKYK